MIFSSQVAIPRIPEIIQSTGNRSPVTVILLIYKKYITDEKNSFKFNARNVSL
jgi:hypothetical protein